MQFRQTILTVLAVALAASAVKAQPVTITLWTIEARVAQANYVAVGTIEKVSCKVIVAPGGRDKIGVVYPDGQFVYTVTLKIGEALKGDLKGTVDDLHALHSVGANNRLEEWSNARTPILWFLGPTPEKGQLRDWEIQPLGKAAAERTFSVGSGPPFLSKDLTFLKDDQEVLARARAYGKTSRQVQPVHTIKIPGAFSPGSTGLDYLVIPVEPTLEQRAVSLIAAPEDFMPKGAKMEPWDRATLRLGGVSSLRHFKSDANAALLRSLLTDPLEEDDISRRELRTTAYEILLHWGVDAPLPKSAQEITSLNLAHSDVTDKGLKQLAELKNLDALRLQETKVTDKGLKELAGLKNLTSLGLSEAQLSDANLHVLREIGLLHCLLQASAGRDERPTSVEEITALSLCRSAVTDAGLRELAGFKNLTWLDLRETRVTDVGLNELAGLKSLTKILLQDTHVTGVGVTELQKALPNCQIDRVDSKPGVRSPR
jgi:Leucine Rich repeat